MPPILKKYRHQVRKLYRINHIWTQRLTGSQRTIFFNQFLGIMLAAIAGIMNGGGYLILKQSTSHMTGTVALMANMVFLKHWDTVLKATGICLCFIGGSVFSTILVILGRHAQRHSQYAFPLMIEAFLLFIFSFLGFSYAPNYFSFFRLIGLTFLLSFIMGMQNAIVTKISHAEVRTTHVTGTITDIGIGIARWMLSFFPHLHVYSPFNSKRFTFHCLLVLSFFSGGLLGIWGFNTLGFYFCLVPITLLIWVSYKPLLMDLKKK